MPEQMWGNTDGVAIPQEKAAIDGDIEALTALIEAETEMPAPVLPNDHFRFNMEPAAVSAPDSNQETREDLLALSKELTALHRELTVAEERSDGRNVHVRSLKKRIAQVTERMARLDQITVLTTPTLGKQSEPEPMQKI